MAEYIDRTALLEKLPDEPYKGVLRRVLMQAPVADVTPVVNGKWVFNEDWWEFRCTNCHKAIGNIKKIRLLSKLWRKDDVRMKP